VLEATDSAGGGFIADCWSPDLRWWTLAPLLSGKGARLPLSERRKLGWSLAPYHIEEWARPIAGVIH